MLFKVYKEKDSQGNPIVTQELTDKLEFMKNNPPISLVSQGVLAWPIETIYENGRLIGFIMPKLAFNMSLKDACSFKHPISDNAKAVEDFPSVKARILIAINLVSTVHELHKSGYIIGDMNHENIGINRQTGQINVVDCDSFHIVDGNGRTFRTKYVMPGYLAPEIIEHCHNERANGHPHSINDVCLPTFTKESDLFCLAKHIFKLLMNGTDPFTGVLDNTMGSAASPFQGNEAIERNAYVFKKGYHVKAKFCLSPNELPSNIIALFKRAFIDGHTDKTARPSTVEWHSALDSYLNSLSQCTANPKHQYLYTLYSCPFCAADNRWEQAQGTVGTLNQPSRTPTHAATPALAPKKKNTGSQTQTSRVTKRSDVGGIVAAVLILIILCGELLLALKTGYIMDRPYYDFGIILTLIGVTSFVLAFTPARKAISIVTTAYRLLGFISQIYVIGANMYFILMSGFDWGFLVLKGIVILLLLIQICARPKSVALSVWITVLSAIQLIGQPIYMYIAFDTYGTVYYTISQVLYYALIITTAFMSHHYCKKKYS